MLRDTPTFARTWVVRTDPVGRLPTADGDSITDLRRTIDDRHPVAKRASAPIGRAPAGARGQRAVVSGDRTVSPGVGEPNVVVLHGRDRVVLYQSRRDVGVDAGDCLPVGYPDRAVFRPVGEFVQVTDPHPVGGRLDDVPCSGLAT